MSSVEDGDSKWIAKILRRQDVSIEKKTFKIENKLRDLKQRAEIAEKAIEWSKTAAEVSIAGYKMAADNATKTAETTIAGYKKAANNAEKAADNAEKAAETTIAGYKEAAANATKAAETTIAGYKEAVDAVKREATTIKEKLTFELQYTRLELLTSLESLHARGIMEQLELSWGKKKSNNRQEFWTTYLQEHVDVLNDFVGCTNLNEVAAEGNDRKVVEKRAYLANTIAGTLSHLYSRLSNDIHIPQIRSGKLEIESSNLHKCYLKVICKHFGISFEEIDDQVRSLLFGAK